MSWPENWRTRDGALVWLAFFKDSTLRLTGERLPEDCFDFPGKGHVLNDDGVWEEGK